MRKALWPLLLGCGTLSLAATTSVTVDHTVFFIGTGSPNGTCEVRDRPDGKREVTCTDGTSKVRFRSDQGCLDSKGSAYCGREVPWREGLGGSQLNCGNRSFYLFSGVPSDNTCRRKGDVKSCRTADGSGFANASCAEGCLATGMAGLCCQVDSGGCPPASKYGDLP